MKKGSKNLLTVILSVLLACIMSFTLVGCTNASSGANDAENVGVYEFISVLCDYLEDSYTSDDIGADSFAVLKNKTYTETNTMKYNKHAQLSYLESADSESLVTKLHESNMMTSRKTNVKIKDVDGVPFVHVSIITDTKGVTYEVSEETSMLIKQEIDETITVDRYYGMLDGKYYVYKTVKDDGVGEDALNTDCYALFENESVYYEHIVSELNDIQMGLTMPLLYLLAGDQMFASSVEEATRANLLGLVCEGAYATGKCFIPIAYADNVSVIKGNDVYTIDLEIGGVESNMSGFMAVSGYHTVGQSGVLGGGVRLVSASPDGYPIMPDEDALLKMNIEAEYAVTDGADFEVLKAIPDVELDEHLLYEDFLYNNRAK